MPPRRDLLAGACALALLTGCSASPSASRGAPFAPAPQTPAVATPSVAVGCGAASGLALPAGWPTGLPLPSGLVVTRTERRTGDRLIAYGRVRGDFHDVVRFFNTRLPKAGLTQRHGQLDPFDAESDFVGRAVQGRWATGLSPECPGSAGLTVLVVPPGAPAPAASPLPSRPAA